MSLISLIFKYFSPAGWPYRSPLMAIDAAFSLTGMSLIIPSAFKAVILLPTGDLEKFPLNSWVNILEIASAPNLLLFASCIILFSIAGAKGFLIALLLFDLSIFWL